MFVGDFGWFGLMVYSA